MTDQHSKNKRGNKTMLSRITKRKMNKEETIPAGYTARVDIESIEIGRASCRERV